MSGSAVFSATIEEITSSTPKHATVSNQSRARSDKPARAKSLSWPGWVKALATRHPLQRSSCAVRDHFGRGFETNSLVSRRRGRLRRRGPDQQLFDHRGGPAAEFLATEAGYRRIHQHVSRDREADDERTHQPDPLQRVVGGGGDQFGRHLL